MLLETIESVNTTLVSNLSAHEGYTIYYGSGSIKEMMEYFQRDDSRFPIMWWAKEENTTLVSSVQIPFSNRAYDTHALSYIFLNNVDIDNPSRETDLNTCDKILTRFSYEWDIFNATIGDITVNSSSKAPLYNNSTNAMVGMAYSINITAPNDLDYCG